HSGEVGGYLRSVITAGPELHRFLSPPSRDARAGVPGRVPLRPHPLACGLPALSTFEAPAYAAPDHSTRASTHPGLGSSVSRVYGVGCRFHLGCPTSAVTVAQLEGDGLPRFAGRPSEFPTPPGKVPRLSRPHFAGEGD